MNIQKICFFNQAPIAFFSSLIALTGHFIGLGFHHWNLMFL